MLLVGEAWPSTSAANPARYCCRELLLAWSASLSFNVHAEKPASQLHP